MLSSKNMASWCVKPVHSVRMAVRISQGLYTDVLTSLQASVHKWGVLSTVFTAALPAVFHRLLLDGISVNYQFCPLTTAPTRTKENLRFNLLLINREF